MRAAVCGFCSFPFFVSAQHDNELSRTKLAAFIIHEAESLFSFFYRVLRFFDLLRLLVERESRNSIALFDMLFAAAHSQNFILQSLMSLFKMKNPSARSSKEAALNNFTRTDAAWREKKSTYLY